MVEIALKKVMLFENLSTEEINKLLMLDNCSLKSYTKNESVFEEGDPCHSVGILLKGQLALKQISSEGEVFMIALFEEHDIFGAAMLGQNKPKYPFSLIALRDSSILFIPFQQIQFMLAQSHIFSANYIHFLTTRVGLYKEKLKMLQPKDVRTRLVFYLSEEKRLLNRHAFELRHSKSAIAEILGVARPSVSRELSKMCTDGLIKLNKRHVELVGPCFFEKKDDFSR